MSTISKHHRIKLSIDKLPNWDLRKISEVCQVLDDHRKPLNETQRNLIPGEIPYCGANGIVGFVNQYTIDDDVILMAEDGGYFDEYQSRPIAYRMKGKIWVNNHAHILKAFPSVNQDFIFYSLAHKNILEYVTGGTRAKLNKGELVNIPLAIPPLEEQKAIAQVLSDFDNLIVGLERLIAKKRSIKEGVMQELLRPKEGWKIIPLGQVAQIKTGKKDNQNKVEDGIYPFFVRSKKVEKIDSYSYDGEAILIPGEGNIGEIFHYVNGKFDYHQRVYKISDFDKCVHGKFVFFYLQEFFGQYALGNSVKATVDSLRLPTFKDFMIQFPSLEEQRVIAQVLSDFDNLIDGLECLIAKKRRIKEGVMQELLTGKTRLV